MRLALYYEVNAALIAPSDAETTGPVTDRRVVMSTGGAP
jgi:hypothetical protein